ncbi:MAG TPA: glycosyltransferase family 2 protein [Saliniramus sp.]|nr:glycosyltransferase family 2 protein [Saliniramus sp.]
MSLPQAQQNHARRDHPENPEVVIVVPTLNEEAHIEDCLTSLLEQAERHHGQIMVMDGGSTDRTREIVREMAVAHPLIRLIDNPKRLQSAALNLAAAIAPDSARVVIRADAHSHYPQNFVEDGLAALKSSGAASVVVPMETIGKHCFQRAVATVQNSLLGNGGAAHRSGAASGFVDHGHHALFERRTFRELGGYDESFTHNEDAEYDHRLRSRGGRIWMCRKAAIAYYPRERPVALARQYYNHGRGRGRTVMRHGLMPKLRQMLPPAALLGTTGGLVASLLHPAFLIFPLVYLAICHGFALVSAVRKREACLLAAGFAAMIMHFAWSFGFLGSVAAGLSTRIGSSGEAANAVEMQNGMAPLGVETRADTLERSPR